MTDPTISAGDTADCARLGKTFGEVLAVAEAWAWVRWPDRREPQTIKLTDLRVTQRTGDGDGETV